jgi:sugar phosphate isomerase/epimerase
MANIPVALQLYSVREECARDLPGTLAAVADMGYEGVEFAGYHGRSAGELRKTLDLFGLKTAGTHVSINALLGEELQRTIDFNRALGNRFLIVPWLPEEMRSSKAQWLKTAQLMNEIAKKTKPQGMRVGYHNHAFEFQPIDGETPWEVFFNASSPDVAMQLDTGNAMHGGISPDGILEIVRKYPGRAATVHLKEFSSRNNRALIGEGEMKWRQLFSLCETIGGTEWYIVEQENCAFSPLECARRCLRNLKLLMQYSGA